jgi:hypothetical protein
VEDRNQEREVMRRMGARGGKKRAQRLTKAQRSEAAKKAARARWGKKRRKK